MKLTDNNIIQRKMEAGMLISPAFHAALFSGGVTGGLGVEPISACYLVSTFPARRSGLVAVKAQYLGREDIHRR